MLIKKAFLNHFLFVSGIIGFYLVAAIASVVSIQSTPLSIGMRATVAITACLVIFSWRRITFRGNGGVILFLMLVFWCIYLYRITIYTTLNPSRNLYAGYYYWLWAIGASFFPGIALALSSVKFDKTKMFLFFYLTLFVIGILTFREASSLVLIDGLVQERGRIQLDSLNPISIGRIGALSLALSMWFFFYFPYEKRKFSLTFIVGLQVVLGAYLLINSGSRGPLIALLATMLMMFLALPRRRMITNFAACFLTLPLLFLAIRVSDPVSLDVALARIISGIEMSDPASLGRMNSYMGALEAFAASPWWGFGFEEPRTGFYPHNSVIEAFLSTGICGGIIFFGLIFFSTLKSFSLLQEKSTASWIVVVFVIYLVQSFFSGSLYQSYGLWISLSMLSVALRDSRSHVSIGRETDIETPKHL